MVRYNTVLGYNTDQSLTPNDHLGLIFQLNYTFYSRYNMDLVAGTEVRLNSKNSGIKRLWCICDVTFAIKPFLNVVLIVLNAPFLCSLNL